MTLTVGRPSRDQFARNAYYMFKAVRTDSDTLSSPKGKSSGQPPKSKAFAFNVFRANVHRIPQRLAKYFLPRGDGLLLLCAVEPT